MSCTCQKCHKSYKVDLIISDDLWKKFNINEAKNGAGLLCGSCIMENIGNISDYAAYKLVKL